MGLSAARAVGGCEGAANIPLIKGSLDISCRFHFPPSSSRSGTASSLDSQELASLDDESFNILSTALERISSFFSVGLSVQSGLLVTRLVLEPGLLL